MNFEGFEHYDGENFEQRAQIILMKDSSEIEIELYWDIVESCAVVEYNNVFYKIDSEGINGAPTLKEVLHKLHLEDHYISLLWSGRSAENDINLTVHKTLDSIYALQLQIDTLEGEFQL